MAEIFKNVEATLDKDWELRAGPKLSEILENVEDFGVVISFRKGHYIVCGTLEQVIRVRDHLRKTLSPRPVHTRSPFIGQDVHPVNVKERRFYDNFSNLEAGASPQSLFSEGSRNYNPIYSRSKEPRVALAKTTNSQSHVKKFEPASHGLVHESVEHLKMDDINAKKVDETGIGSRERDEGGKTQELLVDSDVWNYIEVKMSQEWDQIQDFGAKIEKSNDESGMIKLLLTGEDSDIVSLVYDSLVTLHGDTWKKIVIETFEFHLDDQRIIDVATENVNRHFPRVLVKQSVSRNHYQFIGPAAETNQALARFRQIASAVVTRLEQQKQGQRIKDNALEANDFSRKNNVDRELRHGHGIERHREYFQPPILPQDDPLIDDDDEVPLNDEEFLERANELEKTAEGTQFRCGVEERERSHGHYLPPATENTDEQLIKSLDTKPSLSEDSGDDEASDLNDVDDQDINEVVQTADAAMDTKSLNEIKTFDTTNQCRVEEEKVESVRHDDVRDSDLRSEVCKNGRARKLLKKLQDDKIYDKKDNANLIGGAIEVNQLSRTGSGDEVKNNLKADKKELFPLEDEVVIKRADGCAKKSKAPAKPDLQDVKKILQPGGGLFGTVIDVKSQLQGHEDFGTIVVNMQFPAGEQGSDQPQPGRAYHAMKMMAYLPASRDGKEVSRLMSTAFKQRKLFKIEYTDGDGKLIPDSVEFKTELDGKNGYPDPEYVNRVLQQLTLKVE